MISTLLISFVSLLQITFGHNFFLASALDRYFINTTMASMEHLVQDQLAVLRSGALDPNSALPIPHKGPWKVAASAVAGEKISSEPELVIEATSAILIDTQTGARLFEQNADYQHAIASISKLMAALVFVDNNPGWETIYTVRATDARPGATPNIKAGERITARDLFYDALVASDNAAIIALVNLTGLSEEQFVDRMNQRAVSMGLVETVFTDPTGLSSGNVSTAAEVSVFARQAFLHSDIRAAVLTKGYDLTLLPDTKRRIYSTDDLLGGDLGTIEILGGKTGYVDKAGYCFVGNFSNHEQEVISVVLGAGTIKARFSETAKLLHWYFKDTN
jgi:D-alanyl-D-alanine carboxypeptidase